MDRMMLKTSQAYDMNFALELFKIKSYNLVCVFVYSQNSILAVFAPKTCCYLSSSQKANESLTR